jgi:CBS domain-containing protein
VKVERLYTRNVVGIPRSESIRHAAATMRRFHVGALIVTEDASHAEVAGIVTDRDLVLFALADGLPPGTPVDRLMTPVVASVPEDADALEALARMRAAGVRRLLVTRSPKGDPAGILSIDDLVDGLAAELASAANLMKSGPEREAATLGTAA